MSSLICAPSNPKLERLVADTARPDPSAHPHSERHFRSSATVRDVVIGVADGLTVPFALAAGISGAAAALPQGNHLIVIAGLAEIAAGSIAMGLGGYLAARGEREHYLSERQREEDEIVEKPAHERREIIELMADYGVNETECTPLLGALERNPKAWRDFMMRFELGLEEPDPKRAPTSAATIGLSYIVGGMIPLAPYALGNDVGGSLRASIGLTLGALFVFGWVKGRFSGQRGFKAAVQTMCIGGFAAGTAFFIAHLVK